MSLSLALRGFYSAAAAVDKTLKLTGNGDSLLTRKVISSSVFFSPIKGSDRWLYRALYGRWWMSSPTCGGDGSFVHQNLLNKGLGCSLFVHAFGFDTREEAIQADRIVAWDGMGTLKRIGALGGGLFGGGWEPSIQIFASQISARGQAPGIHHISAVGEDGGALALIPNLVLTAPSLSDGDDGGEKMKVARVSLETSLGVGILWTWAASARVHLIGL